MNTRLLWLLVLLGAVLCQDDGSADEGADAGAEGSGGSGDECEESWEYIEFLRKDVNEKVQEILEGLRDAKNKGGVAVLEDTVSSTMKQVLEIREGILDRIFKLRKSEITICEDQNIKQEENLTNLRMDIMSILLKLIDRDSASIEKLKEIRDDLLEFRMTVNNEVMRVMMLPQGNGKTPKQPTGDCSECELLDNLKTKVENLINCADGNDVQARYNFPADEEGSNTEDAPEEPAADGGDGSGDEGSGECMPPPMYFMELMECNRKIDDETERLFPSLFATVDENERKEIEDKLNSLKGIREEMEDVITKLAKIKPDDEEKLRKTVSRSLSNTLSTLSSLDKDCKSQCGPEGCDSCGAEVLYEMLDKMDYYEEIYNNTESEPADLNDEVRRDLMKFISSNSEESTEILKKKVEGTLDDCDQEKLDVFNKTKNPLWMLVNTTIFAETTEEPLFMVQAMKEMLNQLLGEYCAGEPIPERKNLDDGPSCQWEEYEQTGEYINKIDEIIQESLFKPGGDEAKLDAQLGFIDIKKQLDKRVEKLFLDGMICPDEATTIKKMWMIELNRCMSIFMNSKLKFTEMTRLERIECTKTLRAQMELRRSDLLQQELENSINQIGDEGSAAEQ